MDYKKKYLKYKNKYLTAKKLYGGAEKTEEEKEMITIRIIDDDIETKITVDKNENIYASIYDKFLKENSEDIQIYVFFNGDEIDKNSIFNQTEIDEGARLSIIKRFRAKKILNDIIESNQEKNWIGAKDENIATFLSDREPWRSNKINDYNNTIDTLQLGGVDLKNLPENFGDLKVTGDLDLSNNNQLTSLPESFGNLKVGGHLDLFENQLTSLPENFGNLKVGGNLDLFENQLTSLPESFGNLKVGGNLDLSNNQLTSLPENFGKLEVTGDLDLSNNQLTSLPESFDKLTVCGKLNLSNNPLNSIPSKPLNVYEMLNNN